MKIDLGVFPLFSWKAQQDEKQDATIFPKNPLGYQDIKPLGEIAEFLSPQIARLRRRRQWSSLGPKAAPETRWDSELGTGLGDCIFPKGNGRLPGCWGPAGRDGGR